LVFGLWSLVFGFWFLVFVLCALCFAVRCPRLLFAGQKKTRRQLSLAAGDSKIVCAIDLSAQEHDRQPATSMVVMPMSIVAVTRSKHRSGFIPEEQLTCQIPNGQLQQPLRSGRWTLSPPQA
jgi:hypothetical protein